MSWQGSRNGAADPESTEPEYIEPKNDFLDDEDIKEGWSPQKRLLIAFAVLAVLGGGGVGIFFLVKHLSAQSGSSAAGDSDLSGQSNNTDTILSGSGVNSDIASGEASAVTSGAESAALPEDDADVTLSGLSGVVTGEQVSSQTMSTSSPEASATAEDLKPPLGDKPKEGPEQIVRPEGDITTDSVGVPGNLKPDPALRVVFDGFDYQPSYVAGCNFTGEDVEKDLHLAAQLTKHLRIYSTDCDMPSKVLEGREVLGVDLKFWLGIPLVPDVGFEGPLGDITRAIEKYGKEHINGISIGNEYLISDEAKRASPEKVATIAERVEKVRAALPPDAKDLPLGYVDISGYFINAPDALKGLDFIGINIHPWFEEVSTIDTAASSIFDQYQQALAAATPEQKALSFVAETGWPSASDPGEQSLGGSASGSENMQKFLDATICQSKKRPDPIRLFYFELLNEPWKISHGLGIVETSWGLFDVNRKLKDGITIPTC